MTFCSKCGAALQEGAKFCTECGAPISNEPARALEIMPQTESRQQTNRKRRKRKPLYRRWWVWAAVIVVIVAVVGKRDRQTPSRGMPRQTETIATARPAATSKPAATPKPVATAPPTETVAPTAAPIPEAAAVPSGVSPEFKAAMDSYESFFDEYIDFMKAMSRDPTNTTLLLRYTAVMTQYAETMEKLEAIDESRLSPADDAYYIEVMARIEVKMLQAAQYMQ